MVIDRSVYTFLRFLGSSPLGMFSTAGRAKRPVPLPSKTWDDDGFWHGAWIGRRATDGILWRHRQAGSWRKYEPAWHRREREAHLVDQEFRELAISIRSEPDLFLGLFTEAERAAGGPLAPAIPETSKQFLRSLIECSSSGSWRQVQNILRRCAADTHAWTALRFADHKASWMGQHAST